MLREYWRHTKHQLNALTCVSVHANNPQRAFCVLSVWMVIHSMHRPLSTSLKRERERGIGCLNCLYYENGLFELVHAPVSDDCSVADPSMVANDSKDFKCFFTCYKSLPPQPIKSCLYFLVSPSLICVKVFLVSFLSLSLSLSLSLFEGWKGTYSPQ